MYFTGLSHLIVGIKHYLHYTEVVNEDQRDYTTCSRSYRLKSQVTYHPSLEMVFLIIYVVLLCLGFFPEVLKGSNEIICVRMRTFDTFKHFTHSTKYLVSI